MEARRTVQERSLRKFSIAFFRCASVFLPSSLSNLKPYILSPHSIKSSILVQHENATLDKVSSSLLNSEPYEEGEAILDKCSFRTIEELRPVEGHDQ
jgi:hypothetical protein